jgi:hypothetical protein
MIVFVVYESTVMIPVFGIVEIIAHFKVGMGDWIHIALVSTNIQVSRKASRFSFFFGNDEMKEVFNYVYVSLWR